MIGLAVIRTDQAELGNAVDVALGEGTVPATVDVVSAYDPGKKRPRG